MSYFLAFSAIVSRHGIRSPYPAPNSTVCNNYDAYSNKTFPTYSDWGMTDSQYCSQQLTPHGQTVVPLMGAYYKSLYDEEGLDWSCDTLTVYADNSTRDIQTADLLIQGLECSTDVDVIVAGEDYLSNTVYPVVNDHYNGMNCPLATEDQVSGMYGGDIDALTEAYSTGIQQITDVLGMVGYDATICQDVNPLYNPSTTCTLFETGYQWTGQYYEGDFTSPLSYAGYYAEMFMFQYLSNLTTSKVAFGILNEEDIANLYALHTQNMYYGSNIWNSKAYSSQQLGYLLASFEQYITQSTVNGVEQDISTKLLLLVSHDFNAFYLQRLLNLEYISLGFHQENVATTAGSLTFDLFNDINMNYYVKVKYQAATPIQQRNGTILNLNVPPGTAEIVIPSCGELYCPYNTFKEIVLNVINIDCIEQPLANTLNAMNNNNNNDNNDDDDVDYKAGFAVIMTFFGIGVFYGMYIYYNAKTKQDDMSSTALNSSV
jgi:hypothetical protein